MNPCTRRARGGLVWLTFILAGCGGGQVAPQPEQVNLKQLAVLCGKYAGANKGRMPASLEDLKQFAKKSTPPAGDDLFVSPRDHEPYVSRPSVQMSMPGVGEKKLLAYEKTGVNGKHYVAYTTTEVEEVDEGRFNELVSGK